MHINRSGHVFFTIFFITTIIFFVTMVIIRSCGAKKIIARQQYHYWCTYYECEGCLEYVFAHVCQSSTVPSEISLSYKNNQTYTVSIKKDISENKMSLKGSIEYKSNTVALWQLMLERHENRWHIQKRTITLKSLYSFC